MNALDLFAGIGGASLGLERAGFEVTAVEFDAAAAEMHRHVCSGEVIEADVAAIQLWSMRRPDLLWASPPCQPFSQAGLRRGMDDPRAHLLFQVPRYVKALVPRFVICEQVKAALPWWEAFAAEFEQLGYATWTGKLRSDQFGVPQTRERAFLLASLDGSVAPPAPTHRKFHSRAPHSRPGDEHLLPWVSMADVLQLDGRVGFPRLDDLGTSPDGYRERDWRDTDHPAFTLTEKARSWVVNTGRDWKPGGDRSTAQKRDIDHPAPTVTVDSGPSMWWLEGRQSKATARAGDQPAPTITAGHDVSQWTIQRQLLTPEDALALQSFPPDCLDGADVARTAKFKGIGNAVPPLWAEAIARHLTKG